MRVSCLGFGANKDNESLVYPQEDPFDFDIRET